MPSSYTITITKNVDLTKVNPFKVDVRIQFEDSVFKKRISNVVKDKGYALEFRVFDEHPITKVMKKLFKKLGHLGVWLETGYSSKNLRDCFDPGMVYSFKDKETQADAAIKIENVLREFFDKEFQEYKRLMHAI